MFIKHTEGMFDADGNVANEHTKKFLQGFVEHYVAWVRKQLRA
jgi:chromate reductase